MRPDVPPPADVQAAAADWVVALHASPALTRSPEFQNWLKADPTHARAYHQAAAGWQLSGQVAAELAAELAAEATLRPSRGRPRRARLWWPAGLATAALLLATVWLDQIRPDLRLALTADHASAPGQLQGFDLADGSHTQLDGGSALDFVDSATARRVTLLRGAAWFDVAKDGRPFTVAAGQTRVRALGTRFGVRDCGGCVEITLEEGSIAITAPGRDEILLTPGQQLRLIDGQPPHLRPAHAAGAVDWRGGRYAFYDVPLREVADVLARHGAGQIIFGNQTLAARKISGSIILTDAGAELQALSEAMGFVIFPLPGGQILN